MATDRSVKQRARSKASEEFVMLPHKYNESKHFIGAKGRGKIDINGWYISTKIDGVRARFHNKKLYTRSKKELSVPEPYLEKLSDIYKDLPLDGELIHTNGSFRDTVSTVRTQKSPSLEDWENISYQVFDYVSEEPYYKRLETLQKIENKYDVGRVYQFDPIDGRQSSVIGNITIASIVGVITIVNDPATIPRMMQTAAKQGWEGLILRNPMAPYNTGRTTDLLKVKAFQDCEVTVVNTEQGEGRLSTMLGALICEMDNGKTVRVGTGFSDHERLNPPKIGDRVTISYFELTDDGIPRFPVFISVRNYE